MTARQTAKGVEVLSDSIRIAVILASGHETKAAIGLEDNDADHQGCREIPGAKVGVRRA